MSTLVQRVKARADGQPAFVLVIVTGGTIIMKNKDGVYTPDSNYLDEVVEKTPMLNDPALRKKLPFDHNKLGNIFVLPKVTPSETEVQYCIYKYNPFLDSSNMTLQDYKKIVKDIKAYYDQYDGFVIMHGTDTMSYTASYLSFMMENLGKSVILTGAQIPLCAHRTDGVSNMVGSILLAGNYVIPESALFFDHGLFRGNRTQKQNSEGFDAFVSPNLPPLVQLGVDIDVDWELVKQSPAPDTFSIFLDMQPQIALIRLFTGITADSIKSHLSPPIRGCVLMTYGAGNGPSNNKEIMGVLEEATKREVLLLNCSQCWVGSVTPEYATGAALEKAGVVVGYDITPESGLAKLSYILGQEGLTFEDQRKMLRMDLRGEITLPKKKKCES